MLAALGAAVLCCTVLSAAIFRPRGVQLCVLVSAGLASYAAAALLSAYLSAKAAEPLRAFLQQLTAMRTQGRQLSPDACGCPELAAIAAELQMLSAQAVSLTERAQSERRCAGEMLDALEEGILLLDGDARVLFANKAGCNALGAERDALRGSALRDFEAARPLCEAIGRTPPAAVDIPLPGGRIGQAVIQLAPRVDASGDAAALIVIGDVTAQRETEQVRRAFFEDAAQILRAPAERIKNYAELLCNDMPLGGHKVEDLSKRILKESSRLRAVVKKMILLSRLENGDLSLPRGTLDMAALVRERCNRAEEAAKSHGVSLTCETQDCTLCAARGEMAELLDELLENALCYARTGNRAHVSLTVESDAPCLRVANTGEPLSPEQARRVFDRFYHGRSSSGAGVGLAIVQQIARSYGALCLVTPQPDGALFTVRFPAAAAE